MHAEIGKKHFVAGARADELHSFVRAHIPARLQGVVSSEDVMQDVWITVVRSESELRENGWEDFDPWLMRIARRRIADAIRRAAALKRGAGANVVHERRQTTSFVDLFARVRGENATPSKEFWAKEATHAVQIALASLPEQHRKVVALRYLAGKSHDEIAQATGKSRSAVNALLYRGLRMLKDLIGPAGRFYSDDGVRLESARTAPQTEQGPWFRVS